MALYEKHMVVKKSTIPGAGKGLFTKVMIPKGTRIMEYKGKITSWNNADHDDGNNLYLFYVNKNHVIDGRPYKKSISRYTNDANGFTKIKGIKNNCYYEIDGVKVFIVASKDIPAGSEILVDYGRDYWRRLKEILKLKEREEKMIA